MAGSSELTERQKYCHEGASRNSAFNRGLSWLSQTPPTPTLLPLANPALSCREPEWVALGVQRAGSWWGTGDQRGGSQLRLQSSSGRGPVNRLAFPGMRVVRRNGRLPAGFPIIAHGLWLTCEQCSGISMDLASTHS